MHQCVKGHSEEQLSQWHEDLLASQPCRLEDIHHLCPALASASLDHRYHPSSEWLRRLRQIRYELQSSKSSYMEDIGWLCMVAPQHSVQSTEWRLHGKLLHGLVESAIKCGHRAVQ